MNYKTKNVIKTTFSVVGGLLIIALVLGLCLQFFGPEKAKPSNWLNKQNSNLVKLERGQVIKGVKVDTTKELDLSSIDVPMLYEGYYPLFDYYDDEHSNDLEDDMLFGVVDFGSLARVFGVDSISAKMLVYPGGDSFEESVLYIDSDLDISGAIADLLDCELHIKKGWNKKMLNENGELLFNKRVKIFDTYYDELWNGVCIGALESEWCKHKVVEQGACKECNQCFHNDLKENEKCRVCGFLCEVTGLSYMSDINVTYNTSEQEVFKDIVVKANLSNGQVVDITYPNYTVEGFSSQDVGYNVCVSISYKNYGTSMSLHIICDDEKGSIESAYHRTLSLGESCPHCYFKNSLVSLSEVSSFPTEFVYSENLRDEINSLVDKMDFVCVDKFGVQHTLSPSEVTKEIVISETNVGKQKITIKISSEYIENDYLEITKTFNIIASEVENEQQ